MLLIGSRAAKFHLSHFRTPHDWDFIGTTYEVDQFLNNFSYIDTSNHEKKRRAIVTINDRKLNFEFDLIEHYPSSKIIYENDNQFDSSSSLLGISYRVASLETLFLLKKSHIPFPIHWRKSILDYLELKKYVHAFSPWAQQAYDLRFDEVTKRVHKNMKFDVSNSEFFKKSERFVQRVVEHDSLHYATCFYDEPLFRRAKEDLSMAELSPNKVWAMSEDDIIKMIQEETFVLSLERFIIPALLKRENFDANQVFIGMSMKMVNHYLPLFMRHFAADHYPDILNHQTDFVSKCLQNHPTLKQIIASGFQQKSHQNELARSSQHLIPKNDLMQNSLDVQI